eukprot:GHUV01024968.1.p1 GENE.GHUV01024968.1~~GHUV01024968.1.p1  ORF type:complete len:211 (+),score=39.95 GHUV01024968.1:118-750(+)
MLFWLLLHNCWFSNCTAHVATATAAATCRASSRCCVARLQKSFMCEPTPAAAIAAAMCSVEEAQHLATNTLTPGLIVVHDAAAGCEHNHTKLTAGQQPSNPGLHVVVTDIVTGADHTALVQPVSTSGSIGRIGGSTVRHKQSQQQERTVCAAGTEGVQVTPALLCTTALTIPADQKAVSTNLMMTSVVQHPSILWLAHNIMDTQCCTTHG